MRVYKVEKAEEKKKVNLFVLLEEMKGASSCVVQFGGGVVLGQAVWVVWKDGNVFLCVCPFISVSFTYLASHIQ